VRATMKPGLWVQQIRTQGRAFPRAGCFVASQRRERATPPLAMRTVARRPEGTLVLPKSCCFLMDASNWHGEYSPRAPTQAGGWDRTEHGWVRCQAARRLELEIRLHVIGAAQRRDTPTSGQEAREGSQGQ
jgi:hypothetical protein